MWRAFFSQPDLLTNVFPHSNRIRLTDPAPGEFYPQVRAYHMDDTRIPVRYVGLDKKTNHYSLFLMQPMRKRKYQSKVEENFVNAGRIKKGGFMNGTRSMVRLSLH
nr:hypothetical protein [Photobacterium halotolerans]